MKVVLGPSELEPLVKAAMKFVTEYRTMLAPVGPGEIALVQASPGLHDALADLCATAHTVLMRFDPKKGPA